MGRAVNHYWKPPKKKPPSLVDFELSLVYNPKPTMQDWRNSMAKQKIEVLRGTM